MRLYVKNLEAAEAGNDLREPHAIVSICFPKDERPKPVTNEHTREVLYLAFSDIGRWGNPLPPPDELLSCAGCVPFNRHMAAKVVDMLERTGVEHVILHCLMGTSRSLSMANAISVYYNDEPVRDFTVNYLVFETMLDELVERYGGGYPDGH